MQNSLTQEIETPQLPDIPLLRDITEGLRKLSAGQMRKLRRYYEPFPLKNRNKSSKFVRDLEQIREHYLGLAREGIEQEVYSVIECVANFYGLDKRFRSKLPKIELVDLIRLGQKYHDARIAALDGGHFYPVSVSYFQVPFDEFERPKISLSVRNGLHVEDIVEESLHFLHYVYDSDELTRTMNDAFPDHNFLGLREKGGTSIIIPRFMKTRKKFERFFSNRVIQEALAIFTRIKFGLTSTDYKLEGLGKRNPLGIPNDKSPEELLNTLLEEGRVLCYKKIVDWNNVPDLEHLEDAFPVSGRLGPFYDDLVHHLGYGLGARLSQIVRYKRDLEYLGQLVFVPNSPGKKLDDLLRMYHSLH